MVKEQSFWLKRIECAASEWENNKLIKELTIYFHKDKNTINNVEREKNEDRIYKLPVANPLSTEILIAALLYMYMYIVATDYSICVYIVGCSVFAFVSSFADDRIEVLITI